MRTANVPAISQSAWLSFILYGLIGSAWAEPIENTTSTPFLKDFQDVYITWKPPGKLPNPDHYVIFMFDDGNTRQETDNAIEQYKVAGDITAAVDSRDHHPYQSLIVLAYNDQGSSYYLDQKAVVKREEQADRPEGAVELVAVEERQSRPIDELVLLAVADLLGQHISADPKVTATAENVRHKLDFWTQQDLIQQVYRPVYDRHAQDLKTEWESHLRSLGRTDNQIHYGIKATTAAIYDQPFLRARMVHWIAQDFPQVTAEQRNQALQTIARQVGTTVVKVWSENKYGTLRVDNKALFGDPWTTSKKLFAEVALSAAYLGEQSLDSENAKTALIILDMMSGPGSNTGVELRATINTWLEHDELLRRATRLAKSTQWNEIEQGRDLLADFPTDAHNVGKAQALLDETQKKLTDFAGDQAKLAAIQKADEERKEAFRKTLTGDQVRVFNHEGITPLERRPLPNGGETWVFVSQARDSWWVNHQEYDFDQAGRLINSRRWKEPE